MSILGKEEGSGPGTVGLAYCSPPYSPRMTGQGPVQTHCCLKCSLVCWPPGLPGKEESLSLRPRSPPASPSALTHHGMHCRALMRSHVLTLAHLQGLKQVPRLPLLYSGDCLQDCRKAYTRPSIYTEALQLSAKTITHVSSFLQPLTPSPSIIPCSQAPTWLAGHRLSGMSSLCPPLGQLPLILQLLQQASIHSLNVPPADIHSFIHHFSSRHSFTVPPADRSPPTPD